jgi:hypothetical protein
MIGNYPNFLCRIEGAFSNLARDQEHFNERLLKLLDEIQGNMLDAAFELRAIYQSISEAVGGACTLKPSFNRYPPG